MALVQILTNTMRNSNNGSPRQMFKKHHHHHEPQQDITQSPNEPQQQQQHHHRGFKGLLSRSNIRSSSSSATSQSKLIDQQPNSTDRGASSHRHNDDEGGERRSGSSATSRSSISSSYIAHPQLHSRSKQEVAADFEPNPKIPSSPASSTKPISNQKKWEGAYRNFLSRGTSTNSHSKTTGSSPSTNNTVPSDVSSIKSSSKHTSPAHSPAQSSSPESTSSKKSAPSNKGKTGGGGGHKNLNAAFALLPGTKRLVTRATTIGGGGSSSIQPQNQKHHPPQQGKTTTKPTTPKSVPNLLSNRSVLHPTDLPTTRTIPSLPNLSAVEPSSNNAIANKNEKQSSKSGSSSPDDPSIRGGKFFKALFPRSLSRGERSASTNNVVGTTPSPPTTQPIDELDRVNMKRNTSRGGGSRNRIAAATAADDELDGAMHRGEDKGSYSPSSTASSFGQHVNIQQRGSVGTFISYEESSGGNDENADNGDGDDLDSLLASASNSPHISFCVGGMNGMMTKCSSTGTMLHHPMAIGSGTVGTALGGATPADTNSASNTNYNSYALQHRGRTSSANDVYYSNNNNNMTKQQFLQTYTNHGKVPDLNQLQQHHVPIIPGTGGGGGPQTFRSADIATTGGPQFQQPQFQQSQEQVQQAQEAQQQQGIGSLLSQQVQHQQATMPPPPPPLQHQGGIGSLLSQQVSNYDELDVRQHQHQQYQQMQQQQQYLQQQYLHPQHQQQQPGHNRDSSADWGHFDSSFDMTGAPQIPILPGHPPAPPPSTSSLSASYGTSPAGQYQHHHHHYNHQPRAMADPALKKAFTEFHNAARFGEDATSAFLGDEGASSLHHDSYVSYQMMMMRGGGSSVPYHETLSERNVVRELNVSTSLPLETVDEHSISIHKSLRLLKPMQGTDCWEQGRRYLIAPAALAACPLTVVNKLSGDASYSASEAAAEASQSPPLLNSFGTIDLGECLITYVGERHHLSLGKWSSCRFVLRQNYLLEYDCSASKTSLPRGFCHLQHAVATRHADFQDSFELNFYASPCAKADQRILMVRVLNRDERDDWITCLNRAARLEISDLWDFDPQLEIGRGRYASVYPARRKRHTANSYPSMEECDCALKVVDKNQFWRRVVKGKERADTLVREPSVQSTLTAKCGKVPTFLRLRSFFETSDNVVMELELLKGTDLFDHISDNGVLSEDEAAEIVKDILTSLEAMNRVGLAHRDVKPANILMCDKEKDGVSVKLGDFGMSTFVGVDGLVRGRCGTPGYVAPEILTAGSRVGYGNTVDIFSAGVTLYVMLCGYEPFYGENEKELIEANKAAKIDFSGSEWNNVSDEARDLILKMTVSDPRDRPSAKEALEHPWLKRLTGDNSTRSRSDPTTSDNKDIVLSRVDASGGEGACVIS